MRVANLGYWISSLLLTLSVQAWAELQTNIYEAKFAQADRLKEKVLALYPTAKLAAQNNQLFIRAESELMPEIMELLGALDLPQPHYTISFTANPITTNSKTYSSKQHQIADYTFEITAGQPLNYSYALEEQRLLSFSPYYGPNIESVDKKLDKIEITVNPVNEQQVRVNYHFSYLHNNKREQHKNTVIANLDDWTALGQEAATKSTAKRYGTNKSNSHLYIKVSR